MFDVQIKRVLVSKCQPYHADILAEYTRAEGKALLKEGWEYRVEGGGILQISGPEKTVHTFGKSGGFGYPDLETVKALLLSHFPVPEWTHNITITSYVRG